MNKAEKQSRLKNRLARLIKKAKEKSSINPRQATRLQELAAIKFD
jgi:hypothetical protein